MPWKQRARGQTPSSGQSALGGNRTLTTIAVEAALAAIRTKKSYFGALSTGAW